MLLEKILKRSDNGMVCLVRDGKEKTPLIYREFSGSGEVYRAMQTLSCPYLPHIVAVKQKQGNVYVLEEYIRGDRLDELLSAGPLAEEQAAQIIRHIALALRELHRLGIVHRDVKPENVILRGNEAVLIDFDASRMAKPAAAMDTQVMGTAGYAAPEQYGFSQTDARSDVYALGVLFNVMLTGQHPAKKLAEGKYEALIGKCIEVNADRRYDNIEDFLQALEQPPLSEKVRWERRWPWLTGLLALCLVVLSVAVISVMSNDPALLPPAKVGEILDEPWGKAAAGYTTEFSYDLDGDGVEEPYVFGITIAEPSGLYGDVLIAESFGLAPEEVGNRYLVPCVWGLTEAGEPQMEYAFAELLQEQKITVRYLWEEDVPLPECAPYKNVWAGGVRISFAWDLHIGTWLYSASAELGGVTLTAAATTTVYMR